MRGKKENRGDWGGRGVIFSCIFSIEMMLKLFAFGVFEYFDDGFNVFDSLIVCLGLVPNTINDF